MKYENNISDKFAKILNYNLNSLKIGFKTNINLRK